MQYSVGQQLELYCKFGYSSHSIKADTLETSGHDGGRLTNITKCLLLYRAKQKADPRFQGDQCQESQESEIDNYCQMIVPMQSGLGRKQLIIQHSRQFFAQPNFGGQQETAQLLGPIESLAAISSQPHDLCRLTSSLQGLLEASAHVLDMSWVVGTAHSACPVGHIQGFPYRKMIYNGGCLTVPMIYWMVVAKPSIVAHHKQLYPVSEAFPHVKHQTMPNNPSIGPILLYPVRGFGGPNHFFPVWS